jgi:hypothetical protein
MLDRLDRAELELDPSQGERLDHARYRRDFWEFHNKIRNRSSWKFERRQHFEQPGNPSWDAFHQGRWEEALRLLEAKREKFAREVGEDEANGHQFHRVRIVEEPLTPYLQWELHSLRIQAEVGNHIRVVPREVIRLLEQFTPLPEVVILGSGVLYEVNYTESGVPEGCVRFTEAGVITSWEQFVSELYKQGEDMTVYAERSLQSLPPPVPGAE